MTRWLLIAVFLAATAGVASAFVQSPIVGIASVIDGDTLEIHGQRIRLHGIDAPEAGQFCEKDGKQYRCGQQAALALADKIGRATVRCEHRDIDHYKRIVAVCSLGNVDINAWMVRQGWAIAYRQYSRDYVDDESAAQAEKTVLWAGRFIEPSKWRRGERLQPANQTTVDGCDIKGNINRHGDKIYHMPGGRWYEQARIDENRGQRWFCSEEDAQSAGWRRSRQ